MSLAGAGVGVPGAPSELFTKNRCKGLWPVALRIVARCVGDKECVLKVADENEYLGFCFQVPFRKNFLPFTRFFSCSGSAMQWRQPMPSEVSSNHLKVKRQS